MAIDRVVRDLDRSDRRKRNYAVLVHGAAVSILVASLWWYAMVGVATQTVPQIDAQVQQHYERIAADLRGYSQGGTVAKIAARIDTEIPPDISIHNLFAGDVRFKTTAYEMAITHGSALELLSPAQQFLLYCYEQRNSQERSCEELGHFILGDLKNRLKEAAVNGRLTFSP